MTPIQPAPMGPGRARLQLYLDQELGKLLIFSENGESLADLKIGAGSNRGLPGVRLTNIRGDLRLERLRVGRWDGETPRPVMANESRLQLTDQSIVRGAVERFDAGPREFVVRTGTGSSRVAEDRVEDITLPCAEDEARAAVQVAYQDGTRLRGHWIGVEAGQLFMTVPGIADPIRLPPQGMQSLDVVERIRGNPAQDSTTGTLDLDGVRVMGRLVNAPGRAGEGGLAWQPLSSETASVIRPGPRVELSSRPPAPG